MGKIVSTIAGDFTFQKAQRFRRAYQKAIRNKKSSFDFGGGKWYDVDFAAYLVEYLCQHFPLESEG